VPGPLAGVKILDLSRLLPGPYCSLMLADLGADVLKIEDPKVGDYMRWWSPQMKKQGAFFLMLNRNKRSMKLNLKDAKGTEIFLRLVRGCDVVIEGFRPGVMERLGVGYDRLRRENPALIYCAITGYGQTGPYRNKAGHDLNYLSISGVLSMMKDPKGGPPVIPGVQIADIGGGAMLAAFAILAACIARERTGRGQFIDVSMLDGSFAWLPMAIGKLMAEEDKKTGTGELPLRGTYACYRVYETKDGEYMGLAVLEPQFWEAFCKSVKREDLLPHQFADGDKQEEIIAEVTAIFKEKTRHEWIEFLKGWDCCCEPVNSVSQALLDPQLVARDMVLELRHPTEGSIKQIGVPVKFSETPGEMRLPPPDYGEHTVEILNGLGYSEAQIRKMEEEGII
jgi:crotonobetainyl-CoA:carnitine CoA-transferase CaiB-like acyl-CoA transferase